MRKSKAVTKKSGSLPPGKQLEEDFAVWMRAKLKYRATETGKHITPNSGGATYEFDVYAIRRDPRSIRLARIGALIYFLACAIYFFQWNAAEEVISDAVAREAADRPIWMAINGEPPTSDRKESN